MIRLENISKFYSSNETVALGLRKINLEFNIGEFVAITGESGSGKSTMLNVLSGLDTYEDGEMFISDQATSHFSEQDWENYRNKYISFIFQKYNIIESYTVFQNIEAALIIKGVNQSDRKSKTLEIINKVGLESKTHQKTSTLSGGEIQRTVIARALAKDSKIIVCDEPTGNLDKGTADTIMKLLHEVSKDRLVIVVTHNYELVSKYTTRKIRLFDGEVEEDKVTKKVERNHVSDTKYKHHKLMFKEYMKLTFYNLFAAPKRTVFMLFVFFFISFVFLLTLGARLNQNAIDSFQGYGTFEEATNSRVIVTKRDYTSFTPEELTKLRNLDLVEGVIDYDIVLDMRLLSAEFNNIYNIYDYNEFVVNSVLSIDESELLEGRLPENDNEIIVGPLYEVDIDSEIEMTFRHNDISSGDEGGMQIVETFTIVGKYKSIFPETVRSNAYFTTGKLNQLGKELLIEYTDFNIYPTDLDFVKEGRTEMYIILNNNLDLNEIIVSNDVFTENCRYYMDRSNCGSSDNADYFENTSFVVSGQNEYNQQRVEQSVSITYDDSSFGFQVNMDTLHQLVDENIYQPAVVIKDGFDSEEVVEAIEELGFKAFYPAGVEEDYNLIFIIITRLQFILNMFIVLLITYFISYYVLRNIMLSRNKDYLVFRSFGTTKATLNNIVKAEFSLMAIAGYLIALGTLVLNEINGLFIPKYLRYYEFSDYALLLLLLIVMVLLLVRRFNTKIFSNSVITNMNRN